MLICDFKVLSVFFIFISIFIVTLLFKNLKYNIKTLLFGLGKKICIGPFMPVK